jgi:hypothetical protein
VRVVLLLSIAACGDDLDVRDPHSAFSGSRLRVMHHVFEDGTRQLETTWLHDAERDEDCAPEVWSDGARYCTPPSAPAVFVDGACTTLAGKATPDTTPAYFRREYVLRGDPLPSRLYEPTEWVAAPSLVWQLLDGQCIGPIDADPNADYFALGPELTSAAFAHVVKTDVPTDARLVHSVYTSDDGMQLPITAVLHDSVLGVECTPAALDAQRSATCVPDMPLADLFRDDACTEPALAIRSGAERPAFVAYSDASACPRYAHTGEAIALPSPFRRTTAGCVAAIASNDDRFFAVGAPLELAQLSRLHEALPDRRLASIELGDGDHVWADARLVDTTFDLECERVSTPEGDRCLPTSTLAAEREPTFRDELCTQPLALVLVPGESCGVPTHVVDGTDVHELRRYTGAIYHLSTGDRCLPYALAGSAQSYELRPVLPLSMFASATTVVD